MLEITLLRVTNIMLHKNLSTVRVLVVWSTHIWHIHRARVTGYYTHMTLSAFAVPFFSLTKISFLFIDFIANRYIILSLKRGEERGRGREGEREMIVS